MALIMPTSSPHFVQALLESSESSRAIERRLGAYAMGIVVALRKGRVSIEQASDDLFNLDNLRLVRERHLDARLSELLEWGMELEDVADLAADGIAESLDAMTRLAEQVIARAAA